MQSLQLHSAIFCVYHASVHTGPLVPQNIYVLQVFSFVFLKTTLSVAIHFILKVSLAM